MLSFHQFNEATHARPTNANAWDDSGYDHNKATKAVPKELHGHHEEATKLGWKHSASYHHRPDSGGEQMHHIYSHKDHPGKELHLILGVSGGGNSHSYNPHGKAVHVQSKVTGPQAGSRMVGTRTPAKSRHVDTKHVAGSLKDHLDSKLQESKEQLHPRFHPVLTATKGHKHTLDGKPTSLHTLFHSNNDEDSIEDHQLHHITQLKPHEETEIGPGGAFGTSKLKRTK